MKNILIVVGVLLPSLTWADRFARPNWEAKCKAGKTSFSISFKSVSGASDNDDMKVELSFGKKKIPVEIKPALFDVFKPEGSPDDSCDKLATVKSGNKLMIFFATDQRPKLDNLSALLLDVKARKILEVQPKFGSLYKSKMEGIPEGVRVQLNQGWKKKSDSDGPDNLFAGWKTVNIKGDKIQSAWEKPLPETHQEY
jgi:hypothetical protein